MQDDQVAKDILDEIRRSVMKHSQSPYSDAGVPRLKLTALDRTACGSPMVLEPVVCLILQGAKRVSIGDTTLDYGASEYLLASLDVPARGHIVTASPARPYLAIGLALDRAVLAELVARMPPPDSGFATGQRTHAGFAIGQATEDQLEAWLRLLSLLDRPDDIPMLAPGRERELLYRLLQGPTGAHLRAMMHDEGRMARIGQAIRLIRLRYAEVLPVAELAAVANMSVASFHRNFRLATSMSPLQFQKALRLQRARQLLTSGADAGGAAFEVGYASLSQFSREYRRHFGQAPSREAAKLRPGRSKPAVAAHGGFDGGHV